MNDFINYLPMLIPVMLIQLGLQIYSIINLVKRERVRFNNKAIWALIILVGGTIGTIIYLVFRGDEE